MSNVYREAPTMSRSGHIETVDGGPCWCGDKHRFTLEEVAAELGIDLDEPDDAA